VIRVHGAVRRRPQGTENPRLATGDVEVGVHDVVILGRSKTPPFPISVDEDVDESLRLRFRYLDLRRARMQENMRVRHRLVKAMRDFFNGEAYSADIPALRRLLPGLHTFEAWLRETGWERLPVLPLPAPGSWGSR